MTDQETTKAEPIAVPTAKEIVQNIGATITFIAVAAGGGWWLWGKLRGWL